MDKDKITEGVLSKLSLWELIELKELVNKEIKWAREEIDLSGIHN